MPEKDIRWGGGEKGLLVCFKKKYTLQSLYMLCLKPFHHIDITTVIIGGNLLNRHSVAPRDGGQPSGNREGSKGYHDNLPLGDNSPQGDNSPRDVPFLGSALGHATFLGEDP